MRPLRVIQLFLFLITLCVVAYAFYSEYVDGFQPCPLCVMQRLSAIGFGLVALMGCIVLARRVLPWVLSIQSVFASFGLFFSLRQIWLQHLPVAETTTCVPGLEMMMRYFSWNAILKALFWGTTDCGHVNWTLFGVSMSAWSAVYFFVILTMSLFLFYLFKKSK